MKVCNTSDDQQNCVVKVIFRAMRTFQNTHSQTNTPTAAATVEAAIVIDALFGLLAVDFATKQIRDGETRQS